MRFTYEQEVVDRARRLSENINNYFEEQQYKVSMNEYQMEELTDRYLMNVAIELLISELKEIGIETDQTADDMIEDPSQLETLFALRTKFDADYLYQTLKAFTVESLSEFQNVYEGITLPEDLFLELGPWLAEKFPADPMWSLVYHATTMWYSTEYFAYHLSNIRTKLLDKTDPNKAVVTDANVDSITKFLRTMEIRNDTIAVYISALEKMFPELDKQKLQHYLDTYDTQKLNNDQLPLFAMYNDLQPDEEPDFLKHHHLTVNHHIEYWEDKFKRQELFGINMPTYTKEIGVMIVLSLVLDNLSASDMQNRIRPLEKMISPELFAFTKALTTINYKKIMTE